MNARICYLPLIAIWIWVVSCFPCAAFGQKYLVEFEAVAFKRDLNSMEREKLTLMARDALDREAYYRAKRLQHLRLFVGQHMSEKAKIVLSLKEPVSIQAESDRMASELRAELLDAGEVSCDLKINWGIAVVANELKHVDSISCEPTVKMNEETSVGASFVQLQDKDGHPLESMFLQFLVTARKATPSDLEARPIPKDLGRELFKRHPSARKGIFTTKWDHISGDVDF